MTETKTSASDQVTPRDAQQGGQGAVSQAQPEKQLRQDTAPAEGASQRPAPTDGLNLDQISLLCDIGERASGDVTDATKRDLERLVAEGYAERSAEHRFALTAKGTRFLANRGAGLNEG